MNRGLRVQFSLREKAALISAARDPLLTTAEHRADFERIKARSMTVRPPCHATS
jgi:hypothetical protein